jgi:hypothetical protein
METNLKKLVSVILLASFLGPNVALAESTAAPLEPTIAPLNQGQTAPWPGVLLNAAAVGSIKFDKDNEKEKTDAVVQKAVSDVITQKNGELDMLKVSFNSSLAQKDALLEEKEGQIKTFRDENKKLRDEVANAPSRTTWFGLGLVSGILVTVATAFAMGQVSK